MPKALLRKNQASVTPKGGRKWLTQYAFYNHDTMQEYHPPMPITIQDRAVTFAKLLAEQENTSIDIHIEKRLTNVSPLVGTVYLQGVKQD